MGVIDEIAAERRRQVTKEGWSEEHDDEHEHEQLAQAAACYAWGPSNAMNGPYWPEAWDEDSDRRKDDGFYGPAHPRRRQLIIAGALIVAEVERLDRAEAVQSELARRMAARP